MAVSLYAFYSFYLKIVVIVHRKLEVESIMILMPGKKCK